MLAAAAHRVLGFAADTFQGFLQGVFRAQHIEEAVDTEGGRTHVSAHGLELRVGQHRRVEL